MFLTAYEPFTMVASHLFGRPLISMDNQNELLHIAPPEGTNLFNFLLARAATALCTQGAMFYVVKSFATRTRSTSRVRFVSPIIQQEIRRLKPSKGRHIFAYLTKPNPQLEGIMHSRTSSSSCTATTGWGEEGQHLLPRSGRHVPLRPGRCKAIIATTGFSLIADSIFLKKPYLGVPLKGQFEQTHNARFLRDLRDWGIFGASAPGRDRRLPLAAPVYEGALRGIGLTPSRAGGDAPVAPLTRLSGPSCQLAAI